MSTNNKNNESKQSSGLNWFRNAVLGATMADQPAMMTASGWRQNEKGDYIQDQQNDPHVKQVRDNLAAEAAGVMIGEFGFPALVGAYNLGIRGLGRAGNQWARAKLISKEMKNIKQPSNILNEITPGQIGWAPKQNISGYHASDEEILSPNYWFKGWAQKTHNAPYGFYIADGNGPTSGFLKKRPYIHRYNIDLDKPMVQIGEVNTSAKNATRNEIEKQAMRQGSDGIIYQGIKDNQMSDQIITKTLNPDVNIDKAIPIITKENAHQISDEAWDLAYDAAWKEGNTEKMKELRALHFSVKSGNDPQVFAHSTNNTFNQFDKSFFGQTDEGFNGRGFYFTTTRIPENQSIYKIAKGPNGEIPYMNYGRNKKYFYLKGNREYNVGDPNRNFFEEANTVGFVSPKDSKVSEVVVGQPTQVKNTRAITYDDNGNFIPLSKRDDFTNPDFRYKKGAKILIKKKK